jgi:ACS family hexuronate transporter-like MFS transporter
MLAVGLCLAAPASMLLNTWLPTYLRQSLGIEMSLFTKLNVLMTAGSLGGALLSGGIACVLIYLGLSSSRTRAFLLTACGCLLPFVALAGLLKMPWVILMLSGLVMVGYFGVTTLLYTAVADTLPSRGVAIAMAVGGLAMTPSYMLLPPASGYVIEQLGYGPLFLIGGGVGALAWLVVSLPAWFIKQPDADMAVPRVAGVPPQCG